MIKMKRISILAGSFAVAATVQAAQKPNIIFVMTDDQGYGDLACHGHPYLKTPNIDKLYAESTRLTDYQVSPTCAPTRSAIMSGQYPFRTGVTHTILERERMNLNETTIAEVLKSSGYTTGIFGKWHLGDENPYQPGSRGFDEVFMHGAGGIGQKYPGSCADVPNNKYFDPVIRHNGSFVKTKGYCTDIFFKQALGWIKKNKSRPFYAYICTNAPHGPFIAPEKYKKMYEKSAPKSKQANFYGMITNIDDNMGLLMKKLDEWNLSENTLLVFTTDNGSSAGDFNAEMKGKKNSVNEGGTRVPAFLRFPGKFPAGKDIDQLTRHVDFFPTLAELAGATPAKPLDGKSLLPLLTGKSDKWQDRMTYFHIGRWGKKGDTSRWGKISSDLTKEKYRNFAVRSENWRMVGKNELYDLRHSHLEKENVISKHPEVAVEMLKAYEKWWAEMRPLMINETVPLAKEAPYHADYHKQKNSAGIPEWVEPAVD